MLRAFTADDRDAYARMQANPGVMRYLGVGEVPRRAATWPTMAGNLGQWRLRGYGSFALEESAMG